MHNALCVPPAAASTLSAPVISLFSARLHGKQYKAKRIIAFRSSLLASQKQSHAIVFCLKMLYVCWWIVYFAWRTCKKSSFSQNRFHTLLLARLLLRKQRADGFDNNTGTLKSFPIASQCEGSLYGVVYWGKRVLSFDHKFWYMHLLENISAVLRSGSPSLCFFFQNMARRMAKSFISAQGTPSWQCVGW